MNKRAIPGENTMFSDVKLLDVKQLCMYLSLGKASAEAFAKACGAKRKIGKNARYDKAVIDAALDEMSNNESDAVTLEEKNAESKAES